MALSHMEGSVTRAIDYVFFYGTVLGLFSSGVGVPVAAWYQGLLAGLCVGVGCGMAGFSVGVVLGWIIYLIREGD